MRHANISAFEYPGGALHYSAYSGIYCTKCSGMWRSKGTYVSQLHDGAL